jgi:hypothetical protein
MMGSNHYGTISEADVRAKQSIKNTNRNKISSEGFFDAKPPRLNKKIRPYSAPRGQGMKSTNLKNKVVKTQNVKLRPQTGSYHEPVMQA